MKKVFILFATVASLCFGASAPHTHDGFFFSIAMGFGYQNIDFVTYDYDDDTYNMSGAATDIDIKIGFSATNSLAVHLTLAGDTPLDDMNFDGDDYNANMSLLGLGATYYFPNNFLASASSVWGSSASMTTSLPSKPRYRPARTTTPAVDSRSRLPAARNGGSATTGVSAQQHLSFTGSRQTSPTQGNPPFPSLLDSLLPSANRITF